MWGRLRVGTSHELQVPDDVVVSPYVGAATGASWQAVARAYRKLIDQRIAAGPVDLPAELPHAVSGEAAGAITAWVHHHVHHKGDGPGEALRAPRPPAETVQAGAGDDGDQATLLVALLRQAGIRADVALVAAGWERRVDPDLPGVDAFDRSLVHAWVGAGELWIDPGEELARPGQLPERDQGRRALVIADDTRALATTPRAAPADNTVRDVRTFAASEDGYSRLTSVVRYTGAFEIEHRERVHAMRADQLKKMSAVRVEPEFVGTLDRFASSDAEDLAAPFETSALRRSTVEPGAGDWYVIGRILEQLGLSSDAITAYKRVTRPQEDEVISAYLLAQRRLAAIARP
jgi:hypothetical protein